MSWRLSKAVERNKAVVLSSAGKRLGLSHKGDIGDQRHQQGSGDHTPWSTHRGRTGYPAKGVVHAHDVGAPDAVLAAFESWIRLE